MPRSLVLPPGHRITISVDGDAKTMGVTIVAYNGDEWLGMVSLNQIGDVEQLQQVVDQLTKRGPRLAERK